MKWIVCSRNRGAGIIIAMLLHLVLLVSACSGQTWSFAMISDTHDCDKEGTPTGVTPYLSPIIQYIIAEQPDFVLETGDLITGVLTKKTSPVYEKYDQQYAYYQKVVEPFVKSNIPLYVIRGNHDFGAYDEDKQVTKAYLAVFPAGMPQNGPDGEKGLTYSFVHNNIKFIMLDQYVQAKNGEVTLPMKWLKDELAKNDAGQVLVMSHSPAYFKPAGKDEEDGQKAHFNLFDQKQLRKDFWRTLLSHHVLAYISGHKHLYCRSNIDGLEQIIIGDLGSASDYDPAKLDEKMKNVFPTKKVPEKDDRPGYIMFTVDDDNKQIVANEYWLDANYNRYVYDTITLPFQ